MEKRRHKAIGLRDGRTVVEAVAASAKTKAQPTAAEKNTRGNKTAKNSKDRRQRQTSVAQQEHVKHT